MLTHYDKVRKFWAGEYRFEVPPVNSNGWLSNDWISYIDLRGEWL